MHAQRIKITAGIAMPNEGFFEENVWPAIAHAIPSPLEGLTTANGHVAVTNFLCVSTASPFCCFVSFRESSGEVV